MGLAITARRLARNRRRLFSVAGREHVKDLYNAAYGARLRSPKRVALLRRAVRAGFNVEEVMGPTLKALEPTRTRIAYARALLGEARRMVRGVRLR